MKKTWVIIFLGLLIYFPLLFNGFVWDDEVMFQTGTSVQSNAYFRPVISVVYWGIYNIFGSKPFVFHFFQLIFHVVTAILIFYLFKRFFKETISLILAIIFLVHPALVEAVSFASAMQEITFTMTGMVGLYLFVGKNINYHQIFFGTFLLLMALLMKETAIVFFPLVFFYLLIFRKKDRTVLISYSVLAVILLIGYFLFRISGGNLYTQGPGLFPIMRVSLTTRLINIPMIVLYYLGKFIYPMDLAIAQHWVVRTIDFRNFWSPLILEIFIFISAVAYIIKTKNKVFIFFFLWYLIGLLPHLQIIPLNMTVAERWLYFPMIGLLGMGGAMMTQLKIKSEKLRIITLSITIIIILIFSGRSFIRIMDWRNGLSLFSRDIRHDSSFDLQNNMGVELFRVGEYTRAKKYFETSVKLAPYWWVNWNNLGVIYEREKNYQKAKEYYQKAIDNGQYYLAYENLSKLNKYFQEKNKK
ncbi:MAG: tetratricopeptide repeat protein [Patescibacteria group bacterium]